MRDIALNRPCIHRARRCLGPTLSSSNSGHNMPSPSHKVPSVPPTVTTPSSSLLSRGRQAKKVPSSEKLLKYVSSSVRLVIRPNKFSTPILIRSCASRYIIPESLTERNETNKGRSAGSVFLAHTSVLRTPLSVRLSYIVRLWTR